MVSTAQIIIGCIIFVMTAWTALCLVLNQTKVYSLKGSWIFGIKQFLGLYFCYGSIIFAAALLGWGMKTLDETFPNDTSAGTIVSSFILDISTWLFHMLFWPFFL